MRAKCIALLLVVSLCLPLDCKSLTLVLFTNLESITFWETTVPTPPPLPTPYTFDIDSPELMTRLNDPLTYGNNDFYGWAGGGEFYDVFYSNDDGTFNSLGEYLTVEAIFNRKLPYGGGLNLSEVTFNFIDPPADFNLFIASYVLLGDNALPTMVINAVDNNFYTHTTMGNTVGQSERLRVTLGVETITVIPEPPTFLLLAFGLLGLFTKLYRNGKGYLN